ncbi:MAG TPA: hypothetical protein PKV27_03850 [Ilumatobacteraceae bacterium]|nr:hypothetical protein [Ilumatobacteraceae bacterium]
MEPESSLPAESSVTASTAGLDRRALLRKAAVAGSIAWASPVIVSSGPAAAGVFTTKCAPGTVTATNSFSRTDCLPDSTVISVTITFAGPCPCGGAQLWCAQKNSPTPIVSTTTAALTFTVTLAAFSTITISGKVALGCKDRDGDTQYAVYNWSMTATDNGAPCNRTTNSITSVVLTGRTLVTGAACPSLAGAALVAAQIESTGGATTRPLG